MSDLGAYSSSRLQGIRRISREVKVGSVGVGGSNPIRVQSMTTSNTQDVAATVAQCIRLAEVGCEIIRVTAPNPTAAKALGEIRKNFSAAGFGEIPLVADIHFLPTAAMTAIEHVEKVRVNPGNYADKKRFAVLEYSDTEYEQELERLYEAFSPLVKRAKALGRSLRIGTNHGSLSDRIMNRYGDTPNGMVESALEFIRICESHGFHDIILSMKASNPKVMVQAYRMVVARMAQEGMNYPLHLGVTEAGEGEDARIKSAIGIGALLYDGLGDTVRVSLTEDPWYEVPVCEELVKRAHAHWQHWQGATPATLAEPVSFYEYNRRPSVELVLGKDAVVSPSNPPRVVVPAGRPLAEREQIAKDVLTTHRKMKEARVEGLLVQVNSAAEFADLGKLQQFLGTTIAAMVVELAAGISLDELAAFPFAAHRSSNWVLVRRFTAADAEKLAAWAQFARQQGLLLAIDADAQTVRALAPVLATLPAEGLIYTTTFVPAGVHATGAYRQLGTALADLQLGSPLWVRFTGSMQIFAESGFGQQLLETSMGAGSLFIDGYGDIFSVENVATLEQATALAYNILQGTRLRSTKTEYVACPSCGRTLFDLQEVTQRIKGRTGHLKGVTIAVMGCIVNGPGEMADADFGYVGGAPGKINLYVGKECVQFNIPEKEALDRLIELIRSHNRWVEPEPVAVEA